MAKPSYVLPGWMSNHPVKAARETNSNNVVIDLVHEGVTHRVTVPKGLLVPILPPEPPEPPVGAYRIQGFICVHEDANALFGWLVTNPLRQPVPASLGLADRGPWWSWSDLVEAFGHDLVAVPLVPEPADAPRGDDHSSLLAALDRCEHGRHRKDACFDCPDGQSTGNLFLPSGERIGTTLHGDPIVAPEQTDRAQARAWVPAKSRFV